MSFDEIKGHDRAIGILKRALQEGTLPGAYLFCGEEGIGKSKTALALAAALNCLVSKVDACGRCSSCMKIERGQHPDIRCISCEEGEVIKIEEIRSLKKEMSLKPYEARRRVCIINEAHRLTADASNALLKVLEEPPGESLLVLVSAKPSFLFKTIISRCQTLRFYPLPRVRLEEMLCREYGLEGVPAHYLAHSCDGRLGAALRLKGSDIVAEKNRIIDEFTGGPDEAGDIQEKAEIRELLNTLAGWFRDIYLVKVGLAHAHLVNLDRKRELLEVMGRYTLPELDGIMRSIGEAFFLLEHNINTKLLLANLKVQVWKG